MPAESKGVEWQPQINNTPGIRIRREYPNRKGGKNDLIAVEFPNFAIIPFPIFPILIAFDSLSTYNCISELFGNR
jgi:hypothetical protein